MIYIDVETERCNDNFIATIYKDCVAQKVISYSVKIIAEYIRNISKNSDEVICVSNKEKNLTDYLDQAGVPYRVLNYDTFNLFVK